MKKLKPIAAVILALGGLGGLMNKDYFFGLILIAAGVCLFVFPRNKQKTGSLSAAAEASGLSGIFQITDDAERIHCPDWVVLDVETTGLNPSGDRIIEIAIRKFHEGQLVDTFVSLVNPGQSISSDIVKLTGIKNADLKKAPAFQEIAPTVRSFLGDLPMVAHNAKFDARFVWNECARAGEKLTIQYIDTARLAKWCLPPQPDYKLESLIQTFGLLDHAQEHRALSDVDACENLYMLCREKKARSV